MSNKHIRKLLSESKSDSNRREEHPLMSKLNRLYKIERVKRMKELEQARLKTSNSPEYTLHVLGRIDTLDEQLDQLLGIIS